MRRRLMIGLFVTCVTVAAGAWWAATVVGQAATRPYVGDDGLMRIPLDIAGGHDTDPRDRGRPVVLVAAGLGVKPEVFREAFSRVNPAPGGERPSGERVHDNKRVLLDALGKYGVTNNRLDEVSDHYRYRPGGNELWTHRDATAVANLDADGRLTAVTVTDGGAGYSSPPTVTVPGHPDVRLVVTLAFGKDLKTNGRIDTITLALPATRPTTQP